MSARSLTTATVVVFGSSGMQFVSTSYYDIRPAGCETRLLGLGRRELLRTTLSFVSGSVCSVVTTYSVACSSVTVMTANAPWA